MTTKPLSLQSTRTQTSIQPFRDLFVSKRRKVVIGHPLLRRGGSEAAVMWFIEALKHDYEVTVATTDGWDLVALNEYYGTQVKEHEVQVRIAPIPKLVRRHSAAALRGACFQRFARRIAPEYDVRISAYNPTDWGLRAIHFIQDFSWNLELRNKLDPATPGMIYRDSALRRLYLNLSKLYARPSSRNVLRDDFPIAISKWTSDQLAAVLKIENINVLYPPVWIECPCRPWEMKENAFIIMGRIAPEKRLERAVGVLDGLRKLGHDLKLYICGAFGQDLYSRRIAQMCRERIDWISVEGLVSGSRKLELLDRCRYGIQTREAEPFGISVAELMKTGAIVFASNGGGPREILDHPALLFEDARDAVNKIDFVLRSESLRTELRSYLHTRAGSFGTERFINDARAVVDRCGITSN